MTSKSSVHETCGVGKKVLKAHPFFLAEALRFRFGFGIHFSDASISSLKAQFDPSGLLS